MTFFWDVNKQIKFIVNIWHLWDINEQIRGHSKNTWHFRRKGGVSKNVTWQFLLVFSPVKVDKTCRMGGGGGLKSEEKVSRIILMAPYI
jgi:hypothetical protein